MAEGRPAFLIILTALICLTDQSHGAQQYLGKFLGKLSEFHHGVSGEVYAVDARTIHIKDFTYDGEGPAAYFWAGSTRSPGAAGFRVPDENGSGAVLKRYRRKSITLTLPEGKTLNNIKWFSIWCEEYAVNFGDVKIPRSFDYPKPQKIDRLNGVHGVSSDNIVIVDAQTLLIPNFSYDGEAPDAKFWVGRSSKPNPQGIRIPDENGSVVPLRRYDRKTVVLTLPSDLTVFDIGHFGVWCEAFTVDFGHVQVPQQLNVPPSLKMLGVSPQSKLNCEVLLDDLAFEVRWAVAGESIVLQLVAKLEDGEYMSFGLSGDDSKTQMIDGDVVVAWVDRATVKGYAEDYFLESKSQCSGPRGSCPDERLAENTNSIRLLNAAMVNGYSIITYQRPLKASDELDRQILTNQSQAIIWAIGPLNQRNEVSFHSQYTKKNHFLDFGRPSSWNCPMPETDSSSQQSQSPLAVQMSPPPAPVVQRRKPEDQNHQTDTTTRGRIHERRRGENRDVSERRRDSSVHQQSGNEERIPPRRRGTSSSRGANTTAASTARPIPTPKPVSNRNAWHIPPIECYEPDDGVFYAQMGPTGGKRGYPAITGHVGWGISWYINGLLIPEINVVRGKQYTFIVEGGLDPEIPAKYHPLYITDDPIGGYEYKTPEERQNVRIFAGAKQSRDGKAYPTAIGRLCRWVHTGDKEADDFQSFGAFQRTLELRCDVGEPGFITWTPDENTPDTVYYQCFTHRYLGWKINVLDTCEPGPEASEPKPVVALPDLMPNNGDLKSSSSIIVETRINPIDLFQTTQTKQLSDRPASMKNERPTNSDYSYLHDLGFRQEIITLEQDHYQRPHSQQNHFENNFQSSPELFYAPVDTPFEVDAENRDHTYSKYKSQNLTTTTPINDISSSEAAFTTTTDVNTSSPTAPSSSIVPKAPVPLKHNPMLGPGRRPLKPTYGGNKMSVRRPPMPNRPPFIIKPIMLSMHRPPPIQGTYKKSFYGIPFRKRPVIRPNIHNQQKIRSKPASINQEPIMITKYQPFVLKSTLKPNKQNDLSTTPNPVLSKGTEIVPEKTFSSELMSIKIDNNQLPTMHPAINTGFHPESVVIEGGFKPILTKEIQKRISQNESEELYQPDEVGVIKLNSDTVRNSQQYIESFEPIFIPSPPDSHLLLNKKQNMSKFFKRYPTMKKRPSIMYIVKHVARSAEFEERETDEDEVAMAAERVEAYYLPPDDKKIKPVERVRMPSNIDIPPGTVVTFDGKTVSGVSLTAPVLEPGSYESRSSKAAELLRLSPQFGPFKGEIPPLEPQNINMANLPQLNSQAVINRDLNAPAAGPVSSTGSQTTRLSPVRSYQTQTKANSRTKRNAHHTPEHTLEQEKQKQVSSHEYVSGTELKNNSSYIYFNYNLIYVIIYSFINKYFNF